MIILVNVSSAVAGDYWSTGTWAGGSYIPSGTSDVATITSGAHVWIRDDVTIGSIVVNDWAILTVGSGTFGAMDQNATLIFQPGTAGGISTQVKGTFLCSGTETAKATFVNNVNSVPTLGTNNGGASAAVAGSSYGIHLYGNLNNRHIITNPPNSGSLLVVFGIGAHASSYHYIRANGVNIRPSGGFSAIVS